jgi:preprotein translocase subunit SecA
MNPIDLTGKVYKATLDYYTEKKTARSAREAFPIIKSVYEDQNNSLSAL